jgi:hypothetical protein
MEYHKFPWLRAGIKIVDEPVAEARRIRWEGELRSAKDRGAIENGVKQMRIGIEKNKVRAAVVERIVTFVIDLLLGSFAGIGKRGGFIRSNSRR